MNKLGSEFLKQFDNYERPIAFGMTKRMLVMILGLLIGGSLMVFISLKGLSDIFMYLVAFIIAPPFVLYGMGQDEALKEKILFNLKVQKRGYETDFMEGDMLTKDDFKLWKKVKETDKG
ncbi:TPA: PrgI family protein [Streptococcus pyogenes]|uniref:PrgI family mobile element protein n=1 Tax=Streptococcus TaxID=1301 RepID=UPI001939800D|nr:PrgI family protein [Streptococcus uberis]HEP4573337.1 PrgI family protein [Streptococcus pyogenes]MCK1248658.1 PrgI family protein [Streptococcus uberis]HEP4643527.1 PrgI family protein [Streptococcus pyogenes]HEP4646808.1 PrgI family protein [Streptococcus pyogenes]HEP4648608.1 PrgI family protein [Streptococcus pyogenes]